MKKYHRNLGNNGSCLDGTSRFGFFDPSYFFTWAPQYMEFLCAFAPRGMPSATFCLSYAVVLMVKLGIISENKQHEQDPAPSKTR